MELSNQYPVERFRTMDAGALRSWRIPPSVSLQYVDCWGGHVSVMLDWLWANVGNACPVMQFALRRTLDAIFDLTVP